VAQKAGRCSNDELERGAWAKEGVNSKSVRCPAHNNECGLREKIRMEIESRE
jgi:hypothetical protein